MDKQKANTDTTYCKSETCIDKCWRHKSNWGFDINNNYWFMDCCKEEEKRLKDRRK